MNFPSIRLTSIQSCWWGQHVFMGVWSWDTHDHMVNLGGSRSARMFTTLMRILCFLASTWIYIHHGGRARGPTGLVARYTHACCISGTFSGSSDHWTHVLLCNLSQAAAGEARKRLDVEVLGGVGQSFFDGIGGFRGGQGVLTTTPFPSTSKIGWTHFLYTLLLFLVFQLYY